MAVIELYRERLRLIHPGRIWDIDWVGEVEQMLRTDRKRRKSFGPTV